MDNGNDLPALTPNLEFSDENRKSFKINSGLIVWCKVYNQRFNENFSISKSM